MPARHRLHRPRWILLLVAGLLGASCGGAADTVSSNTEAGAGWPEKLSFAAVPAEQSTALTESFEPVIKMLEKELGLDVELTQVADYAGVIEGMISGKVHMAQFGPFSYVIARNNGAKIEPVGALVDEKGGTAGYQSYGITKAGSPISDLKDYAGKKVCFVDPGSTSGFLYPSAGLIEAGVIASGTEADLGKGLTPVFAGGHDSSALSVKNGDCDAGFAFDSMVDTQLIEDGALKEGELEVVWKSEVIPGSPIAVNQELPQDLRDKLKSLILEKANSEYLLANGFCEGECKLTDEDSWGWVAVDDKLYDGVRAVCKSTKSEKCNEA